MNRRTKIAALLLCASLLQANGAQDERRAGLAADALSKAAPSARVRLEEQSPFPVNARGVAFALNADLEDRPLLKERAISLREGRTKPGRLPRKR